MPNYTTRSLRDRLNIKEILTVPPGLNELMSDISREVLRCNPTHICTFIADYLDALLITRENAKAAYDIEKHLKERSKLFVHICDKLNLVFEEGQSVAKFIQKGFKDYVAKREVDDNPLQYDVDLIYDKLAKHISLTKQDYDSLATIIQRAYRSYRIRKMKLEKSRPLDWCTAYSKTQNILKDCGVSDDDKETAAVTIQAAYRGYYTRKYIETSYLLEESLSSDTIHTKSVTCKDEIFESDNISIRSYDSIMYEVQTKAASVIQKAYRKHKNILNNFALRQYIRSVSSTL